MANPLVAQAHDTDKTLAGTGVVSDINTLQATADGAEGAAAAIEYAGALVGVERGLIRDLISEFVGWLIVEAGIALATSWCSFGASVAVFTSFAVGQGLRLASTIADRLAALSTKLDELSHLVSRMNGSFDQLTGGISQLGNKVDTASANLASRVDNAAHLPDTAGRRVDDFFQGNAYRADSAADKLNQASKQRLSFQEHERLAEAHISGTGYTVRDVTQTNALAGQSYLPHYEPDVGIQNPSIASDRTWSTGDSVKLGSGIVKNLTEQPAELADEPTVPDTDKP